MEGPLKELATLVSKTLNSNSNNSTAHKPKSNNIDSKLWSLAIFIFYSFFDLIFTRGTFVLVKDGRIDLHVHALEL